MFDQEHIALLSDKFAAAQQIVVVVGPKLDLDGVVSAAGLALALEHGGKSVVLCGDATALDQQRDALQSFAGTERFVTTLGNKDLRVSFPYDEHTVDKVSYTIDEQTAQFHLVIQPKKGQKPLDAHSVSFSYVGANADVIMLLGVTTLDELEELYFGYEQVFADALLISLHTCAPEYAQVAFDISEATSYGEAIGLLLPQLQVVIPADAATNFLAGIELKTHHLQSLATRPETFETVAVLLRQHARRSTQLNLEQNKKKNEKNEPKRPNRPSLTFQESPE